MSFQHPSYQSRVGLFTSERDEAAPAREPAALSRPAARHSQRACCCPARPAVVAVMPAANGRRAPCDLLLCGHHYRESRQALADTGAAFFDIRGCPLAAESWPETAW